MTPPPSQPVSRRDRPAKPPLSREAILAAAINLPAYAHTSFMLATSYTAVSGHLGTLELGTPSGGQISALGIRATPGGAITTVPVLAK